jgi:hypothetical protein
MTTLEKIANRWHVQHVDDERNLDHGIIVTLAKDWYYVADPDCGVRGFDTVREAEEGTRRINVIFKGSGNGST